MALQDHNHIVFQHKDKFIEIVKEYSIWDDQDAVIGTVRQVDQTFGHKALRTVSFFLALFMTHKLDVHDTLGTKVFTLTRPRRLNRSNLKVQDGLGAPVGVIRQHKVRGKPVFGIYDPIGSLVGEMRCQNRWRREYLIADGSGSEVGHTEQQEVGALRTIFKHNHRYVLDISPELRDPLRFLVLLFPIAINLGLDP